MISDMTRIGERSPVCKACRWDDGSAVHVGDWFTGRNLLPDRTWETRSEAIAAERGPEFTFVVGRSYARALRGFLLTGRTIWHPAKDPQTQPMPAVRGYRSDPPEHPRGLSKTSSRRIPLSSSPSVTTVLPATSR